MLMAHGPIGFLLTHVVMKKWWGKKITSRQKWLLLALGFVSGIVPDFDIIYIYLVDASKNHRELLSHSLIVYIIAFVVLYLVAILSKRNVVKMGVIIFFLGIMSHLLVDGIFGQVGYLMPFSIELYGISDFTFFKPWVFLINFVLEFTFIALFFFVFCTLLVEKVIWRRVLYVVITLFWVFSLGFSYVLHKHTLHADMDYVYKDIDHDRIRNREDLDIDNDGMINSKDPDSDNNGLSNIEEFDKWASYVHDIWFDPVPGKWLEIPTRLGLISMPAAAQTVYHRMGIFFGAEMSADYALQKDGYEYTPKNEKFGYSVHNIRIWLSHTGRVLPATRVQYKKGDILFFGAEGDTHLALVREAQDNGTIILIEAHKSHGVGPVSYDEVVKREGAPLFVGRILYPITQETIQ